MRNQKKFEGKKVLIRSYDAGVYFGTCEWIKGEQVKIINARNIWHWTGANCLADIAKHGITGDRVSCVITSMILNRVCQIILLSEKAIENLEKQPTWMK